MIPIFTAIMYFITHWYADFVLQTHKQSIMKSTSNKYLLGHTITYSSVWFVFTIGYYMHLGLVMAFMLALTFSSITLFFHTLTDYFTSRVTSSYYKKSEDYKMLLQTRYSFSLKALYEKFIHKFFTIVGLDQALHGIQLFCTYYLIDHIILKHG